MERRRQGCALAHGNWYGRLAVVLDCRQDLYALAGAGYHRRPDEDGVERFGPQSGDVEIRLEAVDLTAVSVAVDLDIDRFQRSERQVAGVAGERDQARAAYANEIALIEVLLSATKSFASPKSQTCTAPPTTSRF